MQVEIESRSAERITRLILEYAARIAEEQNDGVILQLAADLARDLLGADRCSVWLIDRRAGSLATKVAHGVEHLSVRVDDGIVGECVRTNKAILVNDTSSDSRFLGEVDKLTGYITRSILTTPILLDGKVVGAVQCLNKPGGFTRQDEELLSFAGTYAASAIRTERMRQEAERSRLLLHELEMAREVQRGLLPQEHRTVSGVEYGAYFEAAKYVGGDYYDFQELADGMFTFNLGDVSGKGMPAALLMASIQTLLHSQLLRAPLPLSRAVGEVNEAIYRCSPAESYSTLFCGVLDPQRTKLTYVNAGHPEPLFFRGDREEPVHRLSTGGVPIGMMPMLTYEEGAIEIQAGDLIVCFSDGVTEARNSAGQMWEDANFAKVLRAHKSDTIQGVVNSAVDALRAFTAGEEQYDDISVIAIRILPK